MSSYGQGARTTFAPRNSVAEDIALDQFRNDGGDCDLDIPSLAEDRGINRHVLSLDLNLDRQGPELLHLRHVQSNRKSDLVAVARVPIDQHVRRRADRPSVREKVAGEVLEVHLARLLRAVAA